MADAHLRKLREFNIRRGDAASLMDFASRLEDVKRELTSIGPRYIARLESKDMILTLMWKLPDERLKRKWKILLVILSNPRARLSSLTS